LLDATASLLRRQGYHATGLSAIVDESGAPRGSLYFHFPGGKDELACAALEQAGVAWSTRLDAAVASAKDVGDAIDAIVGTLADDLEANGWDNGCPVAAVALEHTSKAVRDAVAAHYAAWLATIADRLVERFAVPRVLARRFATVALSAIEGALLLARVQRSREPLVTTGQALRLLAGLVR
jgi:TetR/AcrR family transcriptional repressor of lmrAB and yxaGH operons